MLKTFLGAQSFIEALTETLLDSEKKEISWSTHTNTQERDATMRVSVVFEGSCKTLHISPHQTVANIKNMIQQSFYMQLSGVDQVQCVLEMRYSGATLQESWCVADIGITTGSRIHCQLKEVQKAVLHVFSAVTKETFPLSGAVIVLSSCSVSTLMSLMSLKLGVPVSAFRLFTITGCPLYDCNLLCDYHLTPGDTLHLETWNGWNEFLRACLRGHKHTLQLHLFQEKPVLRFQKRVALYIAAAHRHLDMASWLMDTGVKAEDPVGVHPYRTWCYKTEHPDSLKCPVHAAAEAGHLLILKLFIGRSAENLTCRDPSDQNVLRIAIKHRHRECVTYLVSKRYTTLNFSGCSLPMNIYLQIKLWIRKARRQQSPFGSRIGDAVQVDGVHMKKISLHPRCRAERGCVEVKRSPCGFEMTSPFVGSSCLSHHPAALPSHNAPVKLPQLHPPHTPKSKRREQNVTRSRACGRKSLEEILPAEKSNGSVGKVLLPLTRRYINTSPRASNIPLKTSQLLCAPTFRQNAICCLNIASSFTEKPWLKQLAVAQTLARRSVQTLLKDEMRQPTQ